jgi:hypothetical protein
MVSMVRSLASFRTGEFVLCFLTRDRKQELHIPAFFFDGFDDDFTADRIHVSDHDFGPGCPSKS